LGQRWSSSLVLQEQLRRWLNRSQIYFNKWHCDILPRTAYIYIVSSLEKKNVHIFHFSLIVDRRNQLLGAVFKYPAGAHNVIKVNGTGFQQCAISAGNGTLTSGNDVIILAIP